VTNRARGIKEKCVHGFDEKSKGKIYFQDLVIDGRIILNYISKKEDGLCGLDSVGSG
jgi:hypothetical protein